MYQTQEKGFLRILTPVNTRNNAEKNFSTIFVRAAVKHNENELEYAKSAKSNDFFSRYWPKTSFWAHFGPNFGPKHFFFQKSKNVTFLDLLKANLMQKIRKI